MSDPTKPQSFIPPQSENLMQDKRQANQRGVARIIAVQALYQLDIGQKPLSEVLAEFEATRLSGDDEEDIAFLPADVSYFRMLVKGVFEEQKLIDQTIAKSMTGKWTLSRLDATIRAILRSGTYELIFRDDIPPAIIVSEYIDITSAFFEKTEVRFVNGVLDSVNKYNQDTSSERF